MATNNRRPFEVKLGKLGIVLFVSGMSLFMFVVFLFGVMVGKHLDAYPERYAGGFVDLVRGRFSRPDSPSKTSAGTGLTADPDQAKQAFDFSFYRTLGEENGRSRSIGGEHTEKNPAADKAVSPDVKDKKISSNSTASGGPGLKRPEAAKSEPAPSEQRLAQADSKSRKGLFEVQVASCRDVHQAERIVVKLKGLGFDPRIEPKDIPDKGKWFRVIAGDFADKDAARAASAKIEQRLARVKCIIRYNKEGGT